MNTIKLRDPRLVQLGILRHNESSCCNLAIFIMNPDCDTQLSLCGDMPNDWARTPPIFGHKILSTIFVYSIKYTESQLNWTVWTNHAESIWKSYRKLEWWSINRFHYWIYICYQIFPSLIKSLMHPFPRYYNDVNSTQTPVSFECASTSDRVSLWLCRISRCRTGLSKTDVTLWRPHILKLV